MQKEEKGQLDIEIYQEMNHLYFKITDDGIGRRKAAARTGKSATGTKLWECALLPIESL